MHVSAQVKLADLPEGDDVDPVNVAAAHLGGNGREVKVGAGTRPPRQGEANGG